LFENSDGVLVSMRIVFDSLDSCNNHMVK
jgi:hypothetical protein